MGDETVARNKKKEKERKELHLTESVVLKSRFIGRWSTTGCRYNDKYLEQVMYTGAETIKNQQ